MNSFAPVLIVLTATSVYGRWYQRSRGRVKAVKPSSNALTQATLGKSLGTRGTLVQFSSAFCTPCRATRHLLENIVANMDDIEHIEIDAEANLDLVRTLDIRSTPTTLILDSRGVEVGRAVGAPKREQVATALAALR